MVSRAFFVPNMLHVGLSWLNTVFQMILFLNLNIVLVNIQSLTFNGCISAQSDISKPSSQQMAAHKLFITVYLGRNDYIFCPEKAHSRC